MVAGKEQRGCGGSLVTEGLGGGGGSCETIRIWDGAHMAEPRTRRGALTAALTTLGETYSEGAATPAPLEHAVV